MSQDDVERVARAIAALRLRGSGVSFDDPQVAEYFRQGIYDEARAALSAMPQRLSPELIAQLTALASRLTQMGEYEACDLIDTVVARVTAMPGRELRYMDEGEQAIMSAALRKSAKVVRRNEPGRELLAEALEALDRIVDFHIGDCPMTMEEIDFAKNINWQIRKTARAAADKIRAVMGGEK